MARTASPRLPLDRAVYWGVGVSRSRAVCSLLSFRVSISRSTGAATSLSDSNSMKEKVGFAAFSVSWA